MLVQCWSDVVDVGPTLNQHCVNVSYLLGFWLLHLSPMITVPRPLDVRHSIAWKKKFLAVIRFITVFIARWLFSFPYFSQNVWGVHDKSVEGWYITTWILYIVIDTFVIHPAFIRPILHQHWPRINIVKFNVYIFLSNMRSYTITVHIKLKCDI